MLKGRFHSLRGIEFFRAKEKSKFWKKSGGYGFTPVTLAERGRALSWMRIEVDQLGYLGGLTD